MSILHRFKLLTKSFVEQFPQVAMTYRLIRDSRYFLKEPLDTPMGFKFIGNRSMQQGVFEIEETKIIKKLLERVDIFINVGANIGYYCCIALQNGKTTVAFEPIDLNLRYLYENIKANKWENNIEVFPIALGNQVRLIEIYGGGTGASLLNGWAGTSEHYKRLVPVSTLDTILGNRFKGKKCLILVDIEGTEKYMLEGASQFLQLEPKPIWMVEISISEHQPKAIKLNPNLFSTFELFWKSNYEAWTADHKMRLISIEEIKTICESGYDSLHTHNFLFIEKNSSRHIER